MRDVPNTRRYGQADPEREAEADAGSSERTGSPDWGYLTRLLEVIAWQTYRGTYEPTTYFERVIFSTEVLPSRDSLRDEDAAARGS